MGSDAKAWIFNSRHLLFQFALPRGERPSLKGWAISSLRFQFALPRGERLAGGDQRGIKSGVSIRAPAWGATDRASSPYFPSRVSIRAPAWGATFGAFEFPFFVVVSIRAPAWGATADLAHAAGGFVVSIRAPAWGATRRRAGRPTRRCRFNSRSRVGSDSRVAPCRV